MEITFVIPGQPFGKQRHRVNTASHMAFTPQKTKVYENWVRMCYAQDFAEFRFEDKKPLYVHIYAYFQTPSSTSAKKVQEMVAGDIRPTIKPDWDNIGKTICDALNGLAYRDDSAIVSATVDKLYTDINPRVIVRISDEGVV